MRRVKQKSQQNSLRYFLLVGIVLIFAATLRFWHLGKPATTVFDEVYHVPAARTVLRDTAQVFEWKSEQFEGQYPADWLHPPAHKYVQALSILVFGDNPFAWRLPSAVFGLLTIVAIGLLAWEILRDKMLALLALCFVACDGLLLVQSRVGMNDSMVTALLWLSFLLYIRYLRSVQTKLVVRSRWLLLGVGLFFGLGLATKWTVAPFLLSLQAFEIFRVVRKIRATTLGNWSSTVASALHWVVFALFVTPCVVYLLFFVPLITQQRGMEKFITLHQEILTYHVFRDKEHAYQATPVQWVVSARPTLYWRGETDAVARVGGRIVNLTTERIYAQSTIVLALLGFGAVIQLTWFALRSKTNNTEQRLPLPWQQLRLLSPLLLGYWTYLGFSLLSPRILFSYHYTVVSPLLSIALAVVLQPAAGTTGSGLWHVRRLQIALVVATLTCFLVWLPVWLGIPVSESVVNRVYFALASWR